MTLVMMSTINIVVVIIITVIAVVIIFTPDSKDPGG